MAELVNRIDPAVTFANGETFNILQIPKSSSALVKDHEDSILTGVDLYSLVSDLSMVGKFTRIAYNGVAGYADLQIKIRKIGVNVSKLCDKSAITVGKFKQTSRTVLVDLQASYQFLLDGMEDIAIVTLKSVATVAEGMAEAAEQLAKAFEEEHDRVEEAHAETLQTKTKEERQKEAKEKEAKRLEIEKEKAALQKVQAEKSFAFHEKEYEKADARQTVFEAPCDEDDVIDFFMEVFTGKKKAGARAAREEKERHLKDRKKQEEIRSKALQDFAEFSKQLENLSEMNSLTEAAINSLHNAMGGLKALAGPYNEKNFHLLDET